MVTSKLLAVRPEVQICSGFVHVIAVSDTDNSMAICLLCVLCVRRAGRFFTGILLRERERERENVSVSVYDLGSSKKKVTLALSLAAAAPQKESNIKFTYRHSNSSRRLLAAPRQCGCFSRVDSFIGHISE